MDLPPPREDSLEAALLLAGGGDRLLLFRPGPLLRPLYRDIPHRAIGVVFVPREEPRSNYVLTRPALRYDAFVFLPRTRALTPLDERGN